MPYEWSKTTTPKQLTLWPYRSLPRRGFVVFIGGTAALISLPLLTVLGSPVLWGLLPFFVAAVAGMYWALQRNYRDGEILETLTFEGPRLHLTRHGPHGKHQTWEANPHWVRVETQAKGGPVPEYITLAGGPRKVELGTFLSEEERIALAQELRQALRDHNARTDSP
ncbi:DUF2244 domain-containing protein (plasmid) [Pseudorhodobacter turbinis]|uniref:DUF2244 domain-containing protein n=1 Tax=Pseudorhodobacter turbinis TaxID=2500533 RepID=A0A4P8EJ51_9RHOB|nr:DUF2244 domain-containing protein [Pseudorhodobacter turbinis]QCO56979.1 DUF2244 domain-containing protein [Pseudorhodobacter turbinis]